jgi:hypothetical protein
MKNKTKKMDYSKRIDNKEAFKLNAFKLFTDACGGSLEEFTNTLYEKYTVEDFSYHDDMLYWGVLDYFKKTVIPHKIAVYQAGLELSRSPKINEHLSNQDKEDFLRNLWLHDISKFSANEAFGYAMYNRKTGYGEKGFELAWHHHKMNNPHHPEYWLNPNRSGELEPLPMPNIYILEMIADWIGAGKTYGSSLEEWLPENINNFKFKPIAKVAEMIRDFTGIRVVEDGYRLIVESESSIGI